MPTFARPSSMLTRGLDTNLRRAQYDFSTLLTDEHKQVLPMS